MSTPAARCFKQTCQAKPTKVFSVMPGVSVQACAKHADEAETLARTGRT